MKIYIAGKITGLPKPKVFNKFEDAEIFLRLKGYNPVNPMKISPYVEGKKWVDYMISDIKQLMQCDAIYLLRDWHESNGARIEKTIAEGLGLIIIKQGEFYEL
jgi:hypothetical protein